VTRREVVVGLLGGGSARAAAFEALRVAIEERKRDVFAATDAAGPGGTPGADPHEIEGAASDAVAGMAEVQTDPALRQYALLESFQFVPRGGDAGRAARALAEAPPESPVWALVSPDPLADFEGLAQTLRWNEATFRYAERAAEAHPSPAVRRAFLSILLEAAHMSGATDQAQRYYSRLLAQFPDSVEAAEARKEFGPDRRIRIGATLPDFSIASLDDPGAILSPASLAGRRVLIEFWATWCGPCVERMPELHRVHQRYAADNFTILSVSVDETRRDVNEFRRTRWPMPWLHGFLADGPGDPAWETFEVVGIPRLVLIDERGVILATDDELRPDLVDAVGRFLEVNDRR